MQRRFCVAPMLDWTDKHCRYFHRLLSTQAVLYTEMVTTGALIHGDRERYLRFNKFEHFVALQLGGSEPEHMAQCAQWAEQLNYDEVNINVGCPSERVQKGAFGACLMAEPNLIAQNVKAMRQASTLPITVKHRIGIDDQDDYSSMLNFVTTVAEAGCKTFIVHARKAWLKGLSPKENREIPPLRYELVYQLKQELPELEIIINGGITTIEQCQQHLNHVDGVMVGREAYYNPWLLSQVDTNLYQSTPCFTTRKQVLNAYMEYVEQQLSLGVPLQHLTKPTLGLFQGLMGAKQFRRHISEQAHKKGAGVEVLLTAMSYVES